MLSGLEQSRRIISKATDPKHKSRLGQFFTPTQIARFMAELFAPNDLTCCRLLDAGAGIGSLSAAFLDKWSGHFPRIELDVFEIDDTLIPYLTETLESYKNHKGFGYAVRSTDFVHAAAKCLSGDLFAETLPKYTHAILNPPYRKIRSDSEHRAALRRAGIETVNLYSAFAALALSLLNNGGQLVAIIPRSFCNGPYYRPFRNLLFERAAIERIHLFTARDKAFKDDDVLQENIIIKLSRGVEQGPVTVSTSTDDTFSDLIIQEHPFDRIVFPDDSERFIHIPTSAEAHETELFPTVCCPLKDLGISVSTGPVVDFRLKEYLREMPEHGTVPLIYPCHFSHGGIVWPKMDIKKPNAILHSCRTEKWLYPNGYYCVVRRLSSKEEKRRIVASVVEPSAFAGASALGFENHLNVFHENRHGLPKAIAHGLAAFLNSSLVDQRFRRFNGHTQVNATDLKLIKYPSHNALIALGEWALNQDRLMQTMIDAKLETLTA